MLSELLKRDMIRLQVEAGNWEEAVRAGGQLLVADGVCEPRYVEAMVRAVKDLGPYMVLAPGIALAHARPEDGMLRVGLSLITLATPVEFGSEVNDPVELVISFGGVDKEKHVHLLRELSEVLMDEQNQELLKKANSFQDVKGVLERVNQE